LRLFNFEEMVVDLFDVGVVDDKVAYPIFKRWVIGAAQSFLLYNLFFLGTLYGVWSQDEIIPSKHSSATPTCNDSP
jgi:hypothetical protein